MHFNDDMMFTLRELRDSKGYSQREVAKLLKISQNFYSDIENGKRVPSIDVLHGLSVLYGTSMDFMYHAYYRQSIVFNLPNYSLEYGMRRSVETDMEYVKARGKPKTEPTTNETKKPRKRREKKARAD